MDDREMLEMAAKAYWPDDEASVRYDEDEGGLLYIHADNQDHNGRDCELVWNPLEDDGDALRLALKLWIVVAPVDVTMSPYEENEKPFTAAYRFKGPQRADVPHDGDADAATRRAIVQVAAQIGKAMP